MAASVDTIEAKFKSFECTLNSLTLQMERYFSAYESLQCGIAGDPSLQMNPVTLLEKMKTIKEKLVRVRNSYEGLKKEHQEMTTQYGEGTTAAEAKVSSTLEYLTSKKNPTLK